MAFNSQFYLLFHYGVFGQQKTTLDGSFSNPTKSTRIHEVKSETVIPGLYHQIESNRF